jgi:hypothetical protein
MLSKFKMKYDLAFSKLTDKLKQSVELILNFHTKLNENN